MNYIGSKHSLLSFLEEHIIRVFGKKSGIFIDGFAGTGAVGSHFQKKGFSIIANDVQYYSFVLNHGKLNIPSHISKIHEYIQKMNTLPEKEGFIYRNYCPEGTKGQEFERMYFSDRNGKKCDAIRQELSLWYQKKEIDTVEYFYLLSCLLEAIDKVANTASVYGAFLKQFKKSAQNLLCVQPLFLEENQKNNYIHPSATVKNSTIEELIPQITGDILYLDPPYNQRQYAPNYHVLETIARYDTPALKGKTGLRDYKEQKSDFCVRSKVLSAFEGIIRNTSVPFIFLSYNNEGLMKPEEIQEVLSRYGEAGYATQEYGRFKADKTENRNHSAFSVTEYLHWVKKK